MDRQSPNASYESSSHNTSPSPAMSTHTNPSNSKLIENGGRENSIRIVASDTDDIEKSPLRNRAVDGQPTHLLDNASTAASQSDNDLRTKDQRNIDELAGFRFSPGHSEFTFPTSYEPNPMAESFPSRTSNRSSGASQGTRTLRSIRTLLDGATSALKQHVGMGSDISPIEDSDSSPALGFGIGRPGTPGKAL